MCLFCVQERILKSQIQDFSYGRLCKDLFQFGTWKNCSRGTVVVWGNKEKKIFVSLTHGFLFLVMVQSSIFLSRVDGWFWFK